MATVNLGTSVGLVYVGFLTGAARLQGDLYLNVENIILNDSVNKFTAQRANPTGPIVMQLNNYSFQMTTVDVNQNVANSELFDSATIIPYSFAVEQANGFVGLNLTDPGVLPDLPLNEPTNVTAGGINQPLYADTSLNPSTRLRVFPGRDTVLPVFVDQTMFAIDGTGSYVGLVPDPNVTFNTGGLGPSLFSDTNQPTTNDPSTSGKIAGYLSDMVQISLANIPAAHLPTEAQTGFKGAVTDFYLSGDRYALGSSKVSNPTNTNPNFEELTLDPTAPIDGIVGQPGTVLSTQFQFGSFPGTYDLLQQNPSVFQTSEITSLFGRWRSIGSLMNLSQTSFDLIVFPNSNESYTYANPADVIALVHGTNAQGQLVVKDVYIGFAWFNSGPKGQVAGAKVYPLSSFVSASTTGEVDFNFNNFTGIGGVATTNEPSIRNGAYSITSSSVPAGFPSTKSGEFVVFRE